LAYGALGVSHQSTEDLAIMRALPDIIVVAPADFAEAAAATHAMIEHNGPGQTVFSQAENINLE